MGISMKKFSRATPQQLAKYRKNVLRLHRDLLLVHSIGMGGVCLFGVGLMIYHLVAKS